MRLVDFTTYNDIRAALGVSSDDLEDATLSLDVYAFNLDAELREMLPSPSAAYEAIRESDPDTMSDNERAFFQATRLFATYSVARDLLPALPMFAPKEHTDGKSATTRFATDPYRETIKRVEAQYEKATARLASTLATLSAVTATAKTPRGFMRVVTRGVDPVTGV